MLNAGTGTFLKGFISPGVFNLFVTDIIGIVAMDTHWVENEGLSFFGISGRREGEGDGVEIMVGRDVVEGIDHVIRGWEINRGDEFAPSDSQIRLDGTINASDLEFRFRLDDGFILRGHRFILAIAGYFGGNLRRGDGFITVNDREDAEAHLFRGFIENLITDGGSEVNRLRSDRSIEIQSKEIADGIAFGRFILNNLRFSFFVGRDGFGHVAAHESKTHKRGKGED